MHKLILTIILVSLFCPLLVGCDGQPEEIGTIVDTQDSLGNTTSHIMISDTVFWTVFWACILIIIVTLF